MQDHPPSPAHLHLAWMSGMGVAAFHRLLAAFGSAEEVFESTPDEISRRAGIPGFAAVKILENRSLEETLDLSEGLASMGAAVWFPETPDVPTRLLRAPTEEWHVLTVLGPTELLDSPKLVGIVGRREATGEGLETAHRLASRLAEEGVPTLSGLATGIDRAAHLGSLSSERGTLGVLPMGLLSFLRERRTLANAAQKAESGLLLLSGAHPHHPWAVSEAMRRNAWIASWCDALVVVEAGEKGGTWKTAQEARKRGRPLFVFTGFGSATAGEGNPRILKDLGAAPLDVHDAPEEWTRRILSVPGEPRTGSLF